MFTNLAILGASHCIDNGIIWDLLIGSHPFYPAAGYSGWASKILHLLVNGLSHSNYPIIIPL